MNKFIISGRTTKDLTLEQTATGVFTTSIPLAENYFYTKDGKKVKGHKLFLDRCIWRTGQERRQVLRQRFPYPDRRKDKQ